MLKKLFRMVFTACGLLLGYGVSSHFINTVWAGFDFGVSWGGPVIIVLITLLFGLCFFNFFPALQRRFWSEAKQVDDRLSRVPVRDLVSGALGGAGGLAVAALVLSIVSPILSEFYIIKSFHLDIIIGILICGLFIFLGMALAKRIAGDTRIVFPFSVSGPKENGRSKSKGAPASAKVLDTSVIIDGRIAGILKTGFLEGDIIIPEFVLTELRHIADSSDSLKRNRGRRGLDILNSIQEEYGIEIYPTQDDRALADIPEVDLKLLKLAQILKGVVVTNDYNLNKVAAIQGVGVLNINELANTLKPAVLPGEKMRVYLAKEGKEHHQAVAYLDDGTMIVVENAREMVGKTVSVIVTSVLQTAAGRMIFAKPEGQKQ